MKKNIDKWLAEGGKKLQAKQAERERQIAASLGVDEPPIPANYCGHMDRLGDLILELKHHGRPLRWRDTESLEALRAMLQERGMELTLKALSNIFAEYFRAMSGRKTIEEMHATPLVDVVATLRGSDDDRWCTVTEAAEIYGLSAGTISRAATAKKIKSNGKSGRKRRLDRADLKRWAREKRPEIAD